MTTIISAAITPWVLWVQRHARMVLATLVIASVAAAVAGTQLFSLNSDVGKLIKPSDDTRWYAQNEAHKAAFPQFENTAVIVITGPGSAVSRASEDLLARLRASDWYHTIAAPGSESFFEEHGLYYLSLDEVSALASDVQGLIDLVGQLPSTDLAGYLSLITQLIQAQQFGIATADAVALLSDKLNQALLNTSGPVAWFPDADNTADEQPRDQLIIVQGRQEFGAEAPAEAVIKATREFMAATGQQYPEATLRLTGELAMADEEIRTALSGIQFAGLMSVVLLALILSIGVRSWSIVLVVFTLLACGVSMTTLFASLAVGSFNTLSLVFLVMFFGLGVDFALHYALRIEESLARADEQAEPLRAATDDIGSALLLCTLTSGLAFLAFFPTEYRGLAELGVISAGGMVIAFFLTVTLIPAWFSVVGMPSPWRAGDRKKQHFGLDQLQPNTVLIGTVFVAGIAAWFAKDARFDYSVLAIRDKNSEAITTLLELQEKALATDYSIAVLAPPESLDELVPQLLALPSVERLTRPSDILPKDQTAKAEALSDITGLDALPNEVAPFEATTTAEALEALLALSEQPISDEAITLLAELDGMALERLQGRLLPPLFESLQTMKPRLEAQPFDVEALPESVKSRLIAPEGRYRLEAIAGDPLNDLAAMDRFVGEVEAIAPNIAGRTVVERGVGQSVVRSFNMAVTLALTGIVVILLLYFREPLTPVLVLIPLGLATLFTFAIIELTGLTLNMANILVIPLVFGLGVDTGIHVVHRYHSAQSVTDVLQSSTPRAVTLSALTTIGTFFSLSFSPHKGAASIGLILSIAISLLMVVTFVVLPALLARFEPLRRKRENAKPL